MPPDDNLTPARRRMLVVLQDRGGAWVTRDELAKALNIFQLSTRQIKKLQQMAQEGIIEVRQRSNTMRRITFEYRVK